MDTWRIRIEQLELAGWAIKDICEETGIKPSSISDIKAGRSKEPTGMKAVKLYELHKRIAGKRQCTA